jgi:hypothetical protein
MGPLGFGVGYNQNYFQPARYRRVGDALTLSRTHHICLVAADVCTKSRTVARRDAGAEPTWMYSRRVQDLVHTSDAML